MTPEEISVTASGPSAPIYANRDCTILAYSANWASETAALQHSHNGTQWQATHDENGDAIVFSSNADNTFKVPGGLWYRIDKSGATAVVVLAIAKPVTRPN